MYKRQVRETPSLRECVELLVDLTLEAGAPDNVTVVMLEIVEQTTDDVRTAAVEIVPSTSPSTVAATVSEGAGRAGNTFGAAKTADAPQNTPSPGETGASATVTLAGGAAVTPLPSGAADSRSDAGTAVGQPAGSATETGEPPTSTDPHLGEHLSAEVLREELAGRPHELVGAAAAAAESGSIPTIAGRTMARRAATVLTHKSEQAREEAEEYRQAGRPRRWVTVSIAAALVAFLTVGLWLGYAWTQTRYYIGEHDQHVAIFNGVSQRLGPIQLSTLEAVTEIRMSDLPEFSQQRVRQTVPARDLYDAQRIVKNLERTGTTAPADECITPSPTPATPGATPDPSATANPGATAEPGVAGTAAPSPSATAPFCEVGK